MTAPDDSQKSALGRATGTVSGTKPTLTAIPGGAAAAQSAAPVAAGPQVRRLKKGELLFAEGENSRAMYLLRSGIIRLYKKKGDAFIELDMVHTGQILGELAFLDGNPRSAYGEAMTECELIEISGPTFQQVLGKLPDWLKILMKTIVGRLRAASTRIRQLESASSSLDYSADGKRSSSYVYLSPIDCLKICSALLLVGSRNGTKTPQGLEIRSGLLQRYANQVMGVPMAKVTSMVDVLAQSGITAFGEGEEAGKIFLKDLDLLEKFIAYANEENLAEPSKRHDLSPKGFLIMTLIVKNLSRYPADVNGHSQVNLAEVAKVETMQSGPLAGTEPFRIDEYEELVKLGYGSTINIKSSSEVFTMIKAETLPQILRLHKVLMGVFAVNENHGSRSSRSG
jgi:CRP-like cAMP-binding protein